MPASDIISHPGLNGPHECAILGKGAQSRAQVGVSKLSNDDDANAPKLYLKGTMLVQVGDAFVRPVVRSGDQDASGQGEYSWFGPPGALEGAIKLNVANLPTNAPGTNMLSPAGTAVFYEGARVPVPASGEQARHAWSGAPLFEADGVTPVLVP